jgi:Flp pilus assembly pilin Flp
VPEKAEKGETYMLELYTRMISREDGQTMAEYAVILGVIVLAIVLALGTLSGAIQAAMNTVAGIV